MISFKEIVPFVFNECVDGNHEKCPGHIKPVDDMPGSHCTCGCHAMTSRKIPDLFVKEEPGKPEGE